VVLKSLLSKAIARYRAKVMLQGAIRSRSHKSGGEVENDWWVAPIGHEYVNIKWKFCILNFIQDSSCHVKMKGVP